MGDIHAVVEMSTSRASAIMAKQKTIAYTSNMSYVFFFRIQSCTNSFKIREHNHQTRPSSLCLQRNI